MKTQYQHEILPTHPMDAQGFRDWEENIAQEGDLVDFHGEFRPIVGFYTNTFGRFALIKRKHSLGRYGTHLTYIVTGEEI